MHFLIDLFVFHFGEPYMFCPISHWRQFVKNSWYTKI